MSGRHAGLLTLVDGFRATQVLHVLAVLGIADRLDEAPATAVDLAARTEVDADSLERVLRLAAYFGVVAEVAGGRFALTELGQGLRSDVPGSMRALAVMLGAEHYRAWADLMYSVRTGKPAFPHIFGSPMFAYLAQHPEAQAEFDAAMAGNVENQLTGLVKACDFSRAAIVVDVGGGNGALAATILTANPSVTAVIEDQAQVLESAREFLGSRGLLERCRLVEGDFFESVPEGGDVYVLSHILHDWDDESALKILRNCRSAQRPSSQLLLLESVMSPHGMPSAASLFDVNMLVMLGGRERTEEEYRSLLAQASFRLTRVIPVSDRRSVIEAEPA